MAEQQEKIRVTCPSCFKRFEVSAKFAGREGPCPSCKKPIKIPELNETVVLREREGFGGVKSASGKLVFKPVAREDATFSPTVMAIVLTGVLLAFAAAYFIGQMTAPEDLTPVVAIGSFAIALPICWSGYWFLRDDELESYQGQELWIRVAICAVAYALLWGLYAFLVSYFDLRDGNLDEDLPFYLITAVLMLIAGSFASAGAFDIPPLSGFLHFSYYMVVTLLLRMTMNLSAYHAYWWQDIRADIPGL